ncbi:hypothetical protein RFI_39968, partial [Reticulomyxa filosa]
KKKKKKSECYSCHKKEYEFQAFRYLLLPAQSQRFNFLLLTFSDFKMDSLRVCLHIHSNVNALRHLVAKEINVFPRDIEIGCFNPNPEKLTSFLSEIKDNDIVYSLKGIIFASIKPTVTIFIFHFLYFCCTNTENMGMGCFTHFKQQKEYKKKQKVIVRVLICNRNRNFKQGYLCTLNISEEKYYYEELLREIKSITMNSFQNDGDDPAIFYGNVLIAGKERADISKQKNELLTIVYFKNNIKQLIQVNMFFVIYVYVYLYIANDIEKLHVLQRHQSYFELMCQMMKKPLKEVLDEFLQYEKSDTSSIKWPYLNENSREISSELFDQVKKYKKSVDSLNENQDKALRVCTKTQQTIFKICWSVIKDWLNKIEQRKNIGKYFHDIKESFAEILEETLEGSNSLLECNCSKSKKLQRVVGVQKHIVVPPKVLIIRLDRTNQFDMKKLFHHIQYPFKFELGDKHYQLIGVCVHTGSNNKSGHYYSWVKNMHNENWFCANDEKVTLERNIDNIVDNGANVLLYEYKCN